MPAEWFEGNPDEDLFDMRSDLRGNDSLVAGSESDPAPRSGPHVGTYDEIARQLTDAYWESRD